MEDYNLPGYFHVAKRARLQSNHKKPMGAYIRFGKEGYWGWNVQKTHPRFADGNLVYSVHAEMKALIHSDKRIYGAQIWVYREVNGKPAMAKPCKYCLKHLIEAGVRTIYYTVPYEPFYERIDL